LKFRILTYNIHRAIGLDRRFAPDRIIEVLSEHNADIVLLQEVDEGVPRSKNLQLAKELAQALDYPYFAMGHNVELRKGSYGNATLSRFPIIYERNIDEALVYLEAAGYPNGEGLPTLTYWIPPGNQFEIVISQIIQSNLLDIGIKVEISTKLESGYWEIWCSYQCQIDKIVDNVLPVDVRLEKLGRLPFF